MSSLQTSASFNETDRAWMKHALELAEQAENEGEVPVGAVVVKDGVAIGEGWNRNIVLNDPSAHAEILALRSAGAAIGNYRLSDCTLYVTLEPCGMCVVASIHARIGRLVFGAHDPKTGALGGSYDLQSLTRFNHVVEVTGGVMAEENARTLKAFFRARR